MVPLSVSATIALALVCRAICTAALAMAWSIRRVSSIVSDTPTSKSCSFSAAAQINAIWRTVSNGYLPTAVSAEHMTASVPSSTALATSLTSARVGTGFSIMLSIICVAVMLKRRISRARRIMRFCSAGTAALPTSTAKSPRATIMPSDASIMSSKFSIASMRSIFATRPGLIF